MTFKEKNKEIMNSLLANGEAVLATKSNTEMKVSVRNSEGYEQQISTLAQVKAEIVDQVVYGEQISDFMTVSTEGGYADSIIYFTEKSVGDADGSVSEDGIYGQATNVEFVREKQTVVIDEWSKGYDVSDTEMEQAMMAGNRSAIVSKEMSYEREKKVYLNKCAFIGERNREGLLNLSSVATDLTSMPLDLSAMSVNQIKAFVADIYGAFQVNCNFTAEADTFVLPKQEKVKLSKIFSEYTNTSVLEILRKAFAEVSGNTGFKILGVAYADKTISGAAKNKYMLYNSGVIMMHLPVDKEVMYPKGFNIRSEKKIRLSAVYIMRPQEAIYFLPVA